MIYLANFLSDPFQIGQVKMRSCLSWMAFVSSPACILYGIGSGMILDHTGGRQVLYPRHHPCSPQKDWASGRVVGLQISLKSKLPRKELIRNKLVDTFTDLIKSSHFWVTACKSKRTNIDIHCFRLPVIFKSGSHENCLKQIKKIHTLYHSLHDHGLLYFLHSKLC